MNAQTKEDASSSVKPSSAAKFAKKLVLDHYPVFQDCYLVVVDEKSTDTTRKSNHDNSESIHLLADANR